MKRFDEAEDVREQGISKKCVIFVEYFFVKKESKTRKECGGGNQEQGERGGYERMKTK